MRLFIIVFLSLLFIYGCGGGGSSGGSGEVEQLSSSTIVGNWTISEFYKDGTTRQWKTSIVQGPRFAGGEAVLTFREDVLIIQNPYSYWVAEDLSNSKTFVANGPVSNLHFNKM